jgi:hypothetical protein
LLYSVTMKVLKATQMKLMKRFKLEMKFRTNLTDSIMFGTQRWCGRSVHESIFEEGLGHFNMILGHLHEHKYAASAIHICFSVLQLEIGLITPILSSPYRTHSLLCLHGWLKITWKILSDSKLTVLVGYLLATYAVARVPPGRHPPSLKPGLRSSPYA